MVRVAFWSDERSYAKPYWLRSLEQAHDVEVCPFDPDSDEMYDVFVSQINPVHGFDPSGANAILNGLKHASYSVCGKQIPLILVTEPFSKRGNLCWPDDETQKVVDELVLQGSCSQENIAIAVELAIKDLAQGL